MPPLKELLRRRIINDIIRAVNPGDPSGSTGRWKLLVTDPKSLRILTSCAKMYDVLEENVTLIENIERKRQPYPELDAVYFISPTELSIERFIDDTLYGGGIVERTRDGSVGKPLYAAAHVFFTTTIPERLFQRIREALARHIEDRYVKKLTEIFVDFIALESICFTVEAPRLFYSLYSPTADQGKLESELDDVARRIVSVLSTLGEYPTIRFFNSSGSGSSSSSNPSLAASAPSRLAHLIQNHLDELCRLDDTFPPATPYQRATLIVVDRTVDLTGALLHEFSYQAMVADLVGGMGAGKVEVAPVDGEGGSATSVNLEESDQLWTSLRHGHIADITRELTSQFNKFLSDNPAAAGIAGGNGRPANDIKDMLSTIQSLPQFADLKAKFSTHITLTQTCLQLYQRRRLNDIATVEQELATGEKPDGTTPKDSFVDMVPLLDSADVTNADKLRLLMLYIISRGEGIQDEDRRKMLQTAKLTPDESDALTNLAYLGVKLSTSSYSEKSWKRPTKARRTYEGITAASKKKGKGAETEKYDVSRYVPVLKDIMEDQIKGVLRADQFPYVKELPPEELAGGKPTSSVGKAIKAASALTGIQPTSVVQQLANKAGTLPSDGSPIKTLRSTRPTWAKKTPQTLRDEAASGMSSGGGGGSGAGKKDDDDELRRNGGRVIVFVLGGMTFSELRSAYEIQKEYRREVVIGTTHMITPAELLANLRDLKRGPPPEEAASAPPPPRSVYAPSPILRGGTPASDSGSERGPIPVSMSGSSYSSSAPPPEKEKKKKIFSNPLKKLK
ncbi:Sec1-like protein [Gonapodya prolifera JEL478]|uniref:Sec1-like protein n=1 Tax=Gonapodya prolifera (strain JEL478) TaxID=1344416 RepID=A0A138ZZF8_GONPJ|nr:Sec1-like protein [Gonapodya prolifera JEL478]|eukprot:KXS09655.1 Sec1-like protein [Gonapodya prolifera JEL478]